MAHYVCTTGGRDYADRANVAETLRILNFLYGDDLRVMHGAAPGADTLVDEEAKRLGIPVKPFPADWARHGKPAGIIRNTAMVHYLAAYQSKGHTVELVVFPGGSGTANMVAQFEARFGVEASRV